MPGDSAREHDRARLRDALAASERLMAETTDLLQRTYALLASMGVRPKELFPRRLGRLGRLGRLRIPRRGFAP